MIKINDLPNGVELNYESPQASFKAILLDSKMPDYLELINSEYLTYGMIYIPSKNYIQFLPFVPVNPPEKGNTRFRMKSMVDSYLAHVKERSGHQGEKLYVKLMKPFQKGKSDIFVVNLENQDLYFVLNREKQFKFTKSEFDDFLISKGLAEIEGKINVAIVPKFELN